jgi:lipopolysaccharide/colanic/teichoic acid biosynthesis glycosyltransferase
MIRFFDILFSGIAIIILFPFMLPLMVILKLTAEHDVFYSQNRIGLHAKEFRLYKFATMLRDSLNLPGGGFTSANDPRILPTGRFLRKTKINELPQLINVFIGQMSIVGYRPLLPHSYDCYSEEVKKSIYNCKPGLSGIGSIVFRNEEEIIQNIDDKASFYEKTIMPYKGLLEIWSAQHMSISFYFKIIFSTIMVVLKPSTNIWKTLFKDIPPIPDELEKHMKKTI